MNILFTKRKIFICIIIFLIFSSFASASPFNNMKMTPSEKFYILGNQPPETPDISGPTIGKPDVELDYKICSTDPEGNDIIYCFEWGDGSGQVCIGPYTSGEEITISHTWIENGTYTITVKASDILGEESGLATLKVKISTIRAHSKVTCLDLIHILRKMNFRSFKLLSFIFNIQ